MSNAFSPLNSACFATLFLLLNLILCRTQSTTPYRILAFSNQEDSSRDTLGITSIFPCSPSQEACPSPSKGTLYNRRVSFIATSASHTLYLDEIGTSFASGDNHSGELGIGAADSKTTVPEYVAKDGEMRGKLIVTAAAGDEHSLFVDSDHRAYATGLNEFGELGVPGNYIERLPIRVNTGALRNRRITQVAAGARHSLFLDEDGLVYATGRNQYGEAGDGSSNTISIPKQVPPSGAMKDKPLQQISAGEVHSLFLDRYGEVYACGKQTNGALGNGQSSEAKISIPVRISGLGSLVGVNVTKVAAGASFSLFLDRDGNVHHTGRNFGGSSHVNTPQFLYKRDDDTSQRVREIATGSQHALLLLEDNTVLVVGKVLAESEASATPAELTSVVSGVKSMCPHVQKVIAGGPHSFLICKEAFDFDRSMQWSTLLLIGGGSFVGVSCLALGLFLTGIVIGVVTFIFMRNGRNTHKKFTKQKGSTNISKKLLDDMPEVDVDSIYESDEDNAAEDII